MTVAARTVAAHAWDRETDNLYSEPDWCSRRLFEVERFEGTIADPCAGLGAVLRGAEAAGSRIDGYDLRDRGVLGVRGGFDFFAEQRPGYWPVDHIVCNPPYGPMRGGTRPRLEEAFIDLALTRARGKVAVFLETKWANGCERGAWLETLPLYREYRLGPRPSVPPGRVLLEGGKAEGGTKDFSWFVFFRGYAGAPTLHWLRRDG